MMGEGKVAGFFAFFGLLIGTTAYGILKSFIQLQKQPPSAQ